MHPIYNAQYDMVTQLMLTTLALIASEQSR